MQAQAIVTVTNNPVNSTIESLHKAMREQFAAMHTAHRPTLAQLQAQERQEAIERIKNILFAKVLVRMVKNHSLAGNSEPLIVNLQTLLEAL